MTPADEAALREIAAKVRTCPTDTEVMDAVVKAFALGRASGWQAGAEAQRASHEHFWCGSIHQPEMGKHKDTERAREFCAAWKGACGPLVTDDQRASVSGERDGIDPILQAASDESMKKALAYMDEQDAKLTDRNAGREATGNRHVDFLLKLANRIMALQRPRFLEVDNDDAFHLIEAAAAVEAALKGGAGEACDKAAEVHDAKKHRGPFGECDREPCNAAHMLALRESLKGGGE